MKRKSQYREALTSFNRTAGQLKRRHPELNPEEFLPKSRNAKAVERAKEKLKAAAERIDIHKRVEEYERKREKIYQERLKRDAEEAEEHEKLKLSEKLKEEDLKRREEQHRQAWESFNTDFMTDSPLSRAEYDLMWETIGEYSNESEALGSPDIIEIYDAMTEKFGYDITPEFVKDFLNKAMENATDAVYKEDYMDAIYDAISKTGSVEDFYEEIQGGDPWGSWF